MIYTSYFAKMRKMTPEQQAKCISIARFTPKGVNISQAVYLAPAKDILFRYKQDGDEEAYTKAYNAYLNTLDYVTVAKSLQGKILCCYEKSNDFCHRHLIAKWLRNHGVECEELKV